MMKSTTPQKHINTARTEKIFDSSVTETKIAVIFYHQLLFFLKTFFYTQ